MRYNSPTAFRQALEQRLKTHAAGNEAQLARDRKRIAFDRLLARLAATAPDRWLVKGGFALDLRLVKDLVDLALIAELSTIDAAQLHMALDETFTERGTHSPPPSLPSPPATWRIPFRDLAEAVGIAANLDGGHAAAAELLDPILSGHVTQGSWTPAARRWRETAPDDLVAAAA